MSARWWELDPKLNAGPETLRFLAESNSVDARDPTSPRFARLQQAVRLGARRAAWGMLSRRRVRSFGATEAAASGDVRLILLSDFMVGYGLDVGERLHQVRHIRQ